MESLKLLVHTIFAITAVSMASSANAALFQFEFSGTVLNSTVAGVNGGNSALITVGLDNGNTTDISQLWTASDLQSVTYDFNNGTVVTTFLNPFGGSLANTVGSFQTDAAGALTSVMTNWSDDSPGTDWVSNDPGGPDLWWLDGFNPVYQNALAQIISLTNTPAMRNASSWTQVSAIPVPAAVWLFGTALVGLVGFGRRKKAA